MRLVVGLISSFLLAGVSAQAEEQVLCIATKNVLVYQADIKTVVFSGSQYETIKPFQGWGETKKTVNVKGQKVNFIKVQFMDRQEEDADNDIGWVKENSIKLKSQCAGYRDPSRDDQSSHEAPRVSGSALNSGDNISGLTDADCCLFPLASSAQVSFTEGMRKFGWNRSDGRKHAAADLYHRDYEPIYAIADGEILRDRQYFYGGTSATEIRHSGGFVARYGEIASPGQKPGLVLGSTVKAGDLIGYMKATKSKRGYNHPMLHFELYTGKRTGPLTPPPELDLPNENYLTAFKRRADLINPTAYLLKWESKRR